MRSGTRRLIDAVALLAGLLVAILAVAFLVGRSRADPPANPAAGTWQCTSLDVHDGRDTGSTARAALDRYLQAAGAPRDGWNLGEPNRFSRSGPDEQRVVSVTQSAVDTWTVVRSEACRR